MTPDRFAQIWLVDFEFTARDGERPDPICMVAREHRSRATVRLGPADLRRHREAPFPVGPDSLVVAYYAPAEMGCFAALGWAMPDNVLDLYAEFACRTNGVATPCGRGLLGALVYYGLTHVDHVEKDEMRQLAMRGGPFSEDELRALVAYCETDVVALDALLPAMQPFPLAHALFRGRFMKAVARMEATGVPIDTDTLGRLRDGWDGIKRSLISGLATEYVITNPDGTPKYGVYDGTTFKAGRFAEYLNQNRIPWPRLLGGALDLSDDAFRQVARLNGEVSHLRELRHTLSQLRLEDLTVGADGRNRVMLSPFRSKTGRNQPSTSQFIFGSSVWLRGLIKPSAGRGLAYIDWSGQEYGIAAALSGDTAMMADYLTGDPYLAFAKRIGAVPADATKMSHPADREAFKVALGLGAMYGAGPANIAATIGQPVAYAVHLLREHRGRYPRFWTWRDAAVDHALLTGELWTVFGWWVRTGGQVNPRSLANFPMQANGAEMMRLACILVTEAGIDLCCPVHDALLIEAPAERLDERVEEARRLMSRASRGVLGGFELRTGVETVVHPHRYRDDKRGGPMWDRVMRLLPS